MPVAYLGEGLHELPEDAGIGGDDGGLVPVASGEVLRGDDCHLCHCSGGIGLQQDELRVIVGEVEPVDGLHEERPEAQRLVGGFMVKDQFDLGDLA